MFERYTERARQVVILAQDAARELKRPEIHSTHIFLGIVRELQHSYTPYTGVITQQPSLQCAELGGSLHHWRGPLLETLPELLCNRLMQWRLSFVKRGSVNWLACRGRSYGTSNSSMICAGAGLRTRTRSARKRASSMS